jgi:RNA polymerase sigma-70 factor (ECF subfamily)
MTRINDDFGLVSASRAGDSDAFGVLVRRYQDRLYPTLLRLTGCAEDAQDLLQDAFVRAFEKLGRFHGDSSFYTWIYRIAVNLTLSDRRRRRLPGREGRCGPELIDPSDDPTQTDPSRPLEQAERDALVQQALLALQPDHRAVVVMKDLDGLRYEEIAETLNIPVGTVRSRLHRARSELRERLKSIVDDEPAVSPARLTPSTLEA